MMVGRLLSSWEGLFSGAMLNYQGVILCQLWIRGHTERGWGREWIIPHRHINHRVHFLSVQGRSSVRKKQYLTTMTHQTKNIKSILPSIYLISNIQHHPTTPPQIARTKKHIAQLLAATNQQKNICPRNTERCFTGVPSLRMPPFVL